MSNKTFKFIMVFGVVTDIIYLIIGILCSNFMMMQNSEVIGYWTYSAIWAAAGIMLVCGSFGLFVIVGLLYYIHRKSS